MIKVIIADDQQMFLDGMKAFLETEPDIEVVATALDGDQTLAILNDHPDTNVLILDVEMPKKNGVEVTKIIKQNILYKKVKVLILTMYNKKEFIVNLMQAGANGYILKNKTKGQLVQAIHQVHNDQPYFGLEILDKAISIPSDFDQKVNLTTREIEVLSLIAEGMTTKTISKKLHISAPTVNTHRRNLLRKLDYSNDKHLVRYAIKKGYVEL